MVDFQVFLESQPWVMYSEFTSLSSGCDDAERPQERSAVNPFAGMNPPRTPAPRGATSTTTTGAAANHYDDDDAGRGGGISRFGVQSAAMMMDDSMFNLDGNRGMFSPISPWGDYRRVVQHSLGLQAKRQKRMTVFEGKCCFLVDQAICAVNFCTSSLPTTAPMLTANVKRATELGSDLFAMNAEIHIDDGGLFFEWTNDQNTIRCLSRINHHLVAFMRRSRPSAKSLMNLLPHASTTAGSTTSPLVLAVQPSWVSFDFGRVQIRLWKTDMQDFSLDLFQNLHEHLTPASPSNNDSDATKISTPGFLLCELNDQAFLDSLHDAMDQVERGRNQEDQKQLFDGLSDIIRLITVKKNNS